MPRVLTSTSPAEERISRSVYLAHCAVDNAYDKLEKAKVEISTLQGCGDGFAPAVQVCLTYLNQVLTALTHAKKDLNEEVRLHATHRR